MVLKQPLFEHLSEGLRKLRLNSQHLACSDLNIMATHQLPLLDQFSRSAPTGPTDHDVTGIPLHRAILSRDSMGKRIPHCGLKFFLVQTSAKFPPALRRHGKIKLIQSRNDLVDLLFESLIKPVRTSGRQ